MSKLGIFIASDHAAAVVVRRSTVVWSARAGVTESAGDTAATLVGAAPAGSWPAIAVAVSPEFAQLKPIAGFPALKQRQLASAVLQQNVNSFFLMTSASMVCGSVDWRSSASAWGVAFDGDVTSAIAAALSRRFRSRARFLPAAQVIASQAESGVHRLVDGHVAISISVQNGEVVEISRCLDAQTPSTVTWPPHIQAVADQLGAEFAFAYAAVRTRRNTRCAWRPPMSSSVTNTVRRATVAATIGLLFASSIGALFAPGIRAARIVATLQAQLVDGRAVDIEASSAEAALEHIDDELAAIDRFRATQGRITLLLAELTQAIPDSTALLSMHVDSTEGVFTALSPRAADLLPALDVVDRIDSPRLVGSLTRETVGSAQLERATMRFRLRHSRAPSQIAARRD